MRRAALGMMRLSARIMHDARGWLNRGGAVQDDATSPLATLDVWMVDCQATGATPAHGHLLELAWWAPDAPQPWSSLVALPAGARLPRPVSEVTGIRAPMLVGAPDAEEIAARWREELERMRAASGVLVAHFARYERPWLEAMAGALGAGELVCTHEMARRLLPELPRRGLRAIAGYYGQEAAEAKRAAEHVEATRLVWRALVAELEAQEGITRMDELVAWLALPAPRGVKRRLPLPDEVRLGLPRAPGVYRMCGKGGQVLYVGKATDLKERVNSYYRGKRGQGDKKLELVVQVWSLDITACRSPLEAALLEAHEIQRLDPPYNTQLRDAARGLLWLDPQDWTSQRAAPDARHTLGPFGWLWVARAAGLWAGLLAGDTSAADGVGWAPGELVVAGARLAFARWEVGAAQDARAATAALSGVMARLAAEQEVIAEQEVVQEDEAPRERGWTAEAMVGVAEYGLVQLARQIAMIDERRALWGRTSAYVWRGVAGSVEVGEGVLTARAGEGEPLVLGLSAPCWEQMDAASWDRLGVLAAELKRCEREAGL
jgi:DNA polymerase III subunit epsilon